MDTSTHNIFLLYTHCANSSLLYRAEVPITFHCYWQNSQYRHFKSFHHLSITSCGLTDSIYDQEILPTNFTIYHKDQDSSGGGVKIAVRNNINTEIIPLDCCLEVLSLKIGIHSPFVLCIVYIPLSSSLDQYLTLFSYLTEITSGNHPVVIIGDFNLPDINWNTLTATSHISTLFCDLVYDLNFTQHINTTTHIQGNILDLIY